MKDGLLLLTLREREVLHLLSKGMTYKEISGQIGTSTETVKKHLKNIYKKLKAKNKIDALNKVNLL